MVPLRILSIGIFVVTVATLVTPVYAFPRNSPLETVLLQNAADPDVYMPLAGGGFGNIGTYGKNAFAAYNSTLSFLKLGGRRTDSADSYGDERGMGLAMIDFMKVSGSERKDFFIESKIGPGGLAFPLGYNESINQAKYILANYSNSGKEIGISHSTQP